MNTGTKTVQNGPVVDVLVVDDDAATVEEVVEYLSEANLRCRSTTDGWAALRLFAEGYRPQVVVSDLRMPELTGMEFAERIKEFVPSERPEIIFVSGHAGMPPEVVDRVFEPFFTTKEVGKGTGLGLSMVYGFTKQSNGHIKIYSEVGKGTTIRLYLPRVVDPKAPLAAETAAPMPTGKERILLVEDDEQVRGGVAQQLASLGYDVTEAADAASGLAIFETTAQPYDLVLTDVVMPGPFGGKKLAEEVTRRRPGIPIVFMSGYSEEALADNAGMDTEIRLLTKPFRKHELAGMIRSALDTPTP